MSALSNGVHTTASNLTMSTNASSNGSGHPSKFASSTTGHVGRATKTAPLTLARKLPTAAHDDDKTMALLLSASTPADVAAALTALHAREEAATAQLVALRGSQQQADLNRALGRLDGLRAGIATQVMAARAVKNNMLAGAAETAARLSGRVRALDLEKLRVEDALRVVDQVAELKACVAGVVGSMGAPQDWEAAAAYMARAARVPDAVARGGFAAAVVPTPEVPDPPWVTLETARESLCGLFLRVFQNAAAEGDGPKVTRFFKLFPLIGCGDVGLDVYGQYVCQGVAGTARAVLKEANGATAGEQGRKDGFFYANALTRLFEHVAHIVDGHGGLVERHYGTGKMVKVIERLQAEVDIQGGIILDSWGDERSVDRKLTDVKSYPFSFLVQSFLPQQRGFAASPRVMSPAVGAGVNNPRRSEDEGVNMKEVDGLLNEIAIMLGRWSLYSRFLAGKCRPPETPQDAPLLMPDVLTKSNLGRKVSGKLITPYNTLTTFFFRRSVEKAFQLDESPSGLSLNMNKPIEANAPFIISAVDDVMYIANAVIQKSISTSQRGVIDQVMPTVSSLLGSDFVGMIQRKMRDESYPKAAMQGAFPPEDKIIAFVVLINSLDLANEYLARIISTHTEVRTNGQAGPSHSVLKDSFPFRHEAEDVAARLGNLKASFSSKINELLSEGLQVLFNQVIKPRLRLLLPETFRDTDYTLTEEQALEAAASGEYAADGGTAEELLLEQVGRRFEHGWDALMRPMQRLMTAKTFATVLDLSARYLARMLEKRVWGLAGRASVHGAMRLERDLGAIVSAVCKGNYAVREVFAKTVQVLMVANMEDDEWEELQQVAAAGSGGDEDMAWVLTEEERRKARSLVRFA